MKTTRKNIDRIKFLQALKEASGSWKDEDHPDIKLKGTYQWVRNQRQQDRTFKD